MWFKRHKKSEQDHALSESLRSLQSLLSETGRREPSLDAGDATPGDPGLEPPSDRPSEPRPPRTANPGAGTRPQAARRDDRSAEPGTPGTPGTPETPDSTGNRWRDLNLSFDAEPVLPKARRDSTPEAEEPESDAGADDQARTAAAGTVDVPDEVSVETTDQPVQNEAPHDPAGESPGAEPVLEPSEVPVDTGEPVLAPDDEPATTDVDDDAPSVWESEPAVPGGLDHPAEPQDRADTPATAVDDGDLDTDHEFRPHSDEDVLVLDLEEPDLPPAKPGTDETDETVRDDEPGVPEWQEAVQQAPLRDAPGSEPIDEPGQDEQAEDQLHLELEPDGNADAGIPVLTNAVYVPDTPPEQPASPALTPPGPAGSPHDADITKCIDDLRVRFQLMGLDALSPAQEKELHDALVEFLDDLQRG